MLTMLPLLVADPSLPAELRVALAEDPIEGLRGLQRLGVNCCDAAELIGVDLLQGPCN